MAGRMRRGARLRLSLLALALAGAGGPAAHAASVEGTWLTESGETKVRIAPCGAQFCGTIVWMAKPVNDTKNPDAAKRSRPLVGSQMMYDLKPTDDGRWDGQLYNPINGKTYSGSATPQGADKLKLSGCVLGGLFCRSQVWTKTQ